MVFATCAQGADATADLVLIDGNVITVDEQMPKAEAVAIILGRIASVGTTAEIRSLIGPETKIVDLKGRTLIPGLIDSHTHPTGASLTEFDHEIPTLTTVADVLRYIRARAVELGEGRWIVVQQVFITRLQEKRYPTRQELDQVAPKNPVIFRTGPDASLNSLALAHFEIDRSFENPPGSKIEKQAQTGEPTGIVRGWGGVLTIPSEGKRPSKQDRYERLKQLFLDYNSVGLTSIADRNASVEASSLYQQLLARNELTLRVAMSRSVSNRGNTKEMASAIKRVAAEPMFRRHDWLRTIGVKMFLDGGMLTGSAYMLEPWGVSEIYSITDPGYRGLRFLSDDQLNVAVQTAVTAGLQFTAHSVGDGAVAALVRVIESVSAKGGLNQSRPNVTHANFINTDTIERMARVGVTADIQPAWLYLDAATLSKQFEGERMRHFQPLRQMVNAGVRFGAGSDHMQKIGSLRSINPYNPFLGMWIAVTRSALGLSLATHPENGITIQEALKAYTLDNAYLLFQEESTGSITTGKWANLVVIDRDLTTCPVDDIRGTQVVQTFVAGEEVYRRVE
ncbi:amidohydrolase [bacterium]|nr:amidohydrolase [bacterium]